MGFLIETSGSPVKPGFGVTLRPLDLTRLNEFGWILDKPMPVRRKLLELAGSGKDPMIVKIESPTQLNKVAGRLGLPPPFPKLPKSSAPRSGSIADAFARTR